jgi:hypothetical protein
MPLNQVNQRETARGAVTYALWSKYQMELPESPWRMAGFIIEQLIEEGYLQGEQNE